MIISDRYRFAFLHIPKCAGTYVKEKIKKYDDTNGKFSRIEHVSGLGDIDLTHIPLSTLENYFKTEYNKLDAYDTFAVVRDPYHRFPSSISQRIKMYKGKNLNSLSKKELIEEVDEAIRVLERYSGNSLPASLIHFQRQVDYIYNGKRKVVEHLYADKSVIRLLNDISDIVDEPIYAEKKERYNEAVVYRNAFLESAFELVKPFAKKIIPPQLKTKSKLLSRKLFYVHRDERYADIFESNYVNDFVGSYYNEDISMYKVMAK